jgi:hypothetical protein
MLYVTEIARCATGKEWPYDQESFMFADTHTELWSARRYFALKPTWVIDGDTSNERFRLTPKKYKRIVYEWAHRDKVRVVSKEEGRAILRGKKQNGII